MENMGTFDIILYICYCLVAIRITTIVFRRLKKSIMIRLETKTLEVLENNYVFGFVRNFIKDNNKEGFPLISLSIETNTFVARDFEFLSKKSAKPFFNLETRTKKGTAKYAFFFIDANGILYLLEICVKKIESNNQIYTHYILKDIMILEKEDIVPIRKAKIERVLYLEDDYGKADMINLTKSIISIKDDILSLYLVWNKDNNIELKYKFENIHVDGILIDERY